jgi:hypothetical protein
VVVEVVFMAAVAELAGAAPFMEGARLAVRAADRSEAHAAAPLEARAASADRVAVRLEAG